MYGWVPSLFTWNYHSIVNRLHPKTKQKVQKKKVLIPGCCFSVILLPTGSGIWTRDLHFYPQEIWCMTPPISLWETVAWRTRVCALSRFSYVWLCVTLWTRAHQAPLSMGILQARLGVGCHALFQGIFPTQGLNPCLLLLLHCRQILYHWATREAPHRSLEPEKSEKWTLLHNIHQVNFKWSK